MSCENFADLFRQALASRGDGPCGRYAPSPSGPLHLGNLRTGLLAWLQARLTGGRFILRMEDLDQPRVRPGSAEQILDDLRWLGLDWDEGPDIGGPVGPYLQSERTTLYQVVLDCLIARDETFQCVCSRKDIADAASAPHTGARSPVYPGTCRNRKPAPQDEADIKSWRYRTPPQSVEIVDVVVGPFRQELAREVGDFVIKRRGGLFAYQLAVVVDDALMGVTDIVRGVDLLDSTPRQVWLFKTLGVVVPRYWHVPLMRDGRGQRLAKRDGSESLSVWREQGRRPEQVVGELAASVGLVAQGEQASAEELLTGLDPTEFLRRIREFSETLEPEGNHT